MGVRGREGGEVKMLLEIVGLLGTDGKKKYNFSYKSLDTAWSFLCCYDIY